MTPVTLTANERRRVEGAGFGNGVLGEAAGACCMLLVFTKQLLIGIDTGGCLRSVRNLGCLPQSAEFPPPFFSYPPGLYRVCNPYRLLLTEEPFNHLRSPLYAQGQVLWFVTNLSCPHLSGGA